MDLTAAAHAARTLANELEYYKNGQKDGSSMALFDDLGSDSGSDVASVKSLTNSPSDVEDDMHTTSLFFDGKIRWQTVDLAQFVITPEGDGKVYVRYNDQGEVLDVGFFAGSERLADDERRHLMDNLDVYVLGTDGIADGYQELQMAVE